MKKVLLISLFLFPLISYAETVKEPFNERIIDAPGRETFYNFPSEHIKGKINVRFVFPENYGHGSASYPAVYTFGVVSEQDIPQENRNSAVFVLVAIQDENVPKENLFKFLKEELFIYTELNYSISSAPGSRLLFAAGAHSQNLLSFALEGGSGANLFLKNPAELEAPSSLKAADENLKIFMVLNKDTAFLLDGIFRVLGLKYGKNYVFVFDEHTDNPAIWPLDFFFNHAAFTAKPKVKITAGKKTVSLSDETDKTALKSSIVFNKKWHADFFMKPLISPPYVNLEMPEQTLNAINGAETGTVTLTEDILGIKTKVKIKIKK